MHGAGGAIALLGDDDLGLALGIRILVAVLVFLVVALAMNKSDHVGVLLDRAGLAQIGEDRLFVSGALLGGAAELGKRDHRYAQLLGQSLESAGDGGDLLGAILIAAGTGAG